jgi:uncharacterized protein YdaU (DUF1376 family)
MNYYEHHLGDYIRDTAHLSMLEEGAYRRLLDAYYVRELPLPADKRECCKLARCSNAAERKAVNAVLEEFFRLKSDGYHQKRADEQLAEYQAGEPDREAKRQNSKERKQRSRERRRALFEELRSYGITPSFDASISSLESQLSRVTSGNGHTDVTRDQDVTGTRDGPVTGQGQDGDGTATQSHPPVPIPQSEDLRLQNFLSKITPTSEVSSSVRAADTTEKGSVCGTFTKIGGEKSHAGK